MPLLLSKALAAEMLQAGGRATGMGRKGGQKPKVSKDKSLT